MNRSNKRQKLILSALTGLIGLCGLLYTNCSEKMQGQNGGLADLGSAGQHYTMLTTGSQTLDTGDIGSPDYFYSSPSTITIPRGQVYGRTNLLWKTEAANLVDIRVGGPNGPMMLAGGLAKGEAETLDWVNDGTTFVLMNSETNVVISRIIVHVVQLPALSPPPPPGPPAPPIDPPPAPPLTFGLSHEWMVPLNAQGKEILAYTLDEANAVCESIYPNSNYRIAKPHEVRADIQAAFNFTGQTLQNFLNDNSGYQKIKSQLHWLDNGCLSIDHASCDFYMPAANKTAFTDYLNYHFFNDANGVANGGWGAYVLCTR